MSRRKNAILVKLAASTLPLAAGLSCIMAKVASYTVSRGDTLSGIAAKHGTTWQDIAKLNGITDPTKLQAGSILRLPQTGSSNDIVPQRVPVSAPQAHIPQYRKAIRIPYPGTRNNPGNMRFYNVGWLGENATGLSRGDFTQFDTPQNGLRAAARNLLTLGARSKKFTIGNIIPAYSPKAENNVTQHIKNISTVSGIGKDQVIDGTNDSDMVRLLRGVVTAESGKNAAGWYYPSEYLAAVRRARVSM